MDFVEQRGERHKGDRSQVRVHATTAIEPQSSVDEHCQNEIFRDVSELADDAVPEIDSGR